MLTSVRGLVAATFLFGCGLAATPALADETDPPSEFTVTGNVAGVTDYRFRGLSLSGGDFAVQGGITVNHSSGFYVGTWGSSLEQDPLDDLLPLCAQRDVRLVIAGPYNSGILAKGVRHGGAIPHHARGRRGMQHFLTAYFLRRDIVKSAEFSTAPKPAWIKGLRVY